MDGGMGGGTAPRTKGYPGGPVFVNGVLLNSMMEWALRLARDEGNQHPAFSGGAHQEVYMRPPLPFDRLN